MQSAVVIGTGVAGLATAIRLSAKGYRVQMYEQNSYPGGKLTSFQLGSYRFDAGPSLFTMPHFLEALFKEAGKDIKEYFNYKKKEVICNYYWDDGTTMKSFADKNRFAKEIKNVLGVDKQILQKYWANSFQKYELTKSLFLEKSLHQLSTYLSYDTIKAIANISQLDLNTSLHEVNKKRLKNEKLIQFYDRFATYNGSSPYKSPGIMSLIPHLEENIGTYVPDGGMISITNALVHLAQDLGVDINYNAPVEGIHIEKKRAIGIVTKGKLVKADKVISNMDIVPTYRKLLPQLKAPEKILQQPRSTSALIFYWGINTSFPALDLHNILFSSDYRGEFEQMDKSDEPFDDPTVYINISSKDVPEDAPEGCENWFVMINVPANRGLDWDHYIAEARQAIINKINSTLEVDVEEYIEEETMLDPRLIEQRTSSYQGALYGAASNNKMAAFLRHPNFKSDVKGLYFCGGSVHPGGGIPLCLLSAKIVSDLIPNAYA